jgi:hypothetical protein
VEEGNILAKIICYDAPDEPLKNYQQLVQVIQKYPGYCMITKSCWIVSTLENPIQIADKLSPYVDSKDRLFVGMLTPGFYNASWTNTLVDDHKLNKVLDCY